MGLIMSWSQCSVEIAKTGADDALCSPLFSVGLTKDKGTSLSMADGERLTAKASGGVLVAMEDYDGQLSLTTRVIETGFKVISQILGTSITTTASALQAATSIKVKKGSKAAVGKYYSNGTVFAAVTGIDTVETGYDTLTISLGAALSSGDVLFECNSAGELLIPTTVAPDKWSFRVTPKNVGGTGIQARKCNLSFKDGWSEEEGQYADLTFTVEACADGELYTKFKKS